MPAYDNVVIKPQFVLTSEAAIEAVVFIVTNNKGYINVICCLVSKGPFIYYVSTFFLSTTTFSRIFLSDFFLHLLKFQNAAWKIRLNVMVKKKFFGFTKTTIFVKNQRSNQEIVLSFITGLDEWIQSNDPALIWRIGLGNSAGCLLKTKWHFQRHTNYNV